MKKVFNLKSVLLAVASFVLAAQSVSLVSAADVWSHTVTRSGANITVDWQDKPGATRYTLIASRGGVQSGPIIVTESKFVDTATKPNLTYTYTVSATLPVENPEAPVEGEPAPTETYEQVLFTTKPFSYKLDTLTAGAKLNSFNSIKLTYKNINGASGYQIYRATSKSGKYSHIKTTPATTFTNTGLSLNKTYFYKVRAYQNINGKTYYTNTVVTSGVKTVLGKTKLTAATPSYNAVKLTYKKADGATSYKIYRSTSSNKGFKHIKTTSSLSYVASSLETGKTYYFKVRPYRGGTASSYSNTVKVKPVLNRVSKVSATPNLKSVKVSWTKVSGASGYKLYRATSKTGSYKHIKTTKSLSHNDTKLGDNATYYYKVVAYRTIGKKTVNASATTPIKAVTPRPQGVYKYTKDSLVVLEMGKVHYNYYAVCSTKQCDFGSSNVLYDDVFRYKAYAFVPANHYLAFYSLPEGRITAAENYKYSPKNSFDKTGWYLVGADLVPGSYRITGSNTYDYCVGTIPMCYPDDPDFGEYVKEADEYATGETFLDLEEGDFLRIDADNLTKIYGVRLIGM